MSGTRISFRELAEATAAIRAALAADRAWWARNDPVAYVWLCRAERRGAQVPWSGKVARK